MATEINIHYATKYLKIVLEYDITCMYIENMYSQHQDFMFYEE